MRSRLLLVVGAVAVLVSSTAPVVAQTPLGYVAARGQTVTPAFEGWYVNPDGTKTLSFGYYNRTVDEMAHAWIDVTYLSEEDYEAEVAKRDDMKAQQSSGPSGSPNH